MPHTQELFELATAPIWLVWSNEHRAWWAPDHCDYVREVEHAGRYTFEEAMRIASARNGGLPGKDGNPGELIQPSPEWIELRAKAIAKAKGESNGPS